MVNDIFRDVVQKIYQGFLHFQYSVKFRSALIGVISCSPGRKACPSLHPFFRNSQLLDSTMRIFLTMYFTPKRSRNIEIAYRNSFTPLSKVYLSLCWFVRNALLPHKLKKICYTEFHENPTDGVVKDRWTDRQTDDEIYLHTGSFSLHKAPQI